MALTRQQKEDIVTEVSDLLGNSKMTVLAKYSGTTVKAIQQLRKQAEETNTTVHVIKNRLVIKVLEQNKQWESVDKSVITGQLLYAFNSEDEVAPAQVLANFNKTNSTLEFVGALTADGQFMSADDVKSLASLPSKEQLRSQLVGTLAAPLSGFVNVMAGNIRGVLTALSARAETIK